MFLLNISLEKVKDNFNFRMLGWCLSLKRVTLIANPQEKLHSRELLQTYGKPDFLLFPTTKRIAVGSQEGRLIFLGFLAGFSALKNISQLLSP